MKIGSLMVDAAGKIASPLFSKVSPLSRSRMTYPVAPRSSEASRSRVDSSFIRISARFGSDGGDADAAPGARLAPDTQTISRSAPDKLVGRVFGTASGAGARNEGDGRVAGHALLPAGADGGDHVGEQTPDCRHRRITARPARDRGREDALEGAARRAAVNPVEAHRVHGGEGEILPAPAARRQEQRIEGATPGDLQVGEGRQDPQDRPLPVGDVDLSLVVRSEAGQAVQER